METPLAPCPFCGGPAEFVPDRLVATEPDHAYVMCKRCDVYAPHIDGPTVEGHDYDARAGEAAAWNRRAAPPGSERARTLEDVKRIVKSIVAPTVGMFQAQALDAIRALSHPPAEVPRGTPGAGGEGEQTAEELRARIVQQGRNRLRFADPGAYSYLQSFVDWIETMDRDGPLLMAAQPNPAAPGPKGVLDAEDSAALLASLEGGASEEEMQRRRRVAADRIAAVSGDPAAEPKREWRCKRCFARWRFNGVTYALAPGQRAACGDCEVESPFVATPTEPPVGELATRTKERDDARAEALHYRALCDQAQASAECERQNHADTAARLAAVTGELEEAVGLLRRYHQRLRHHSDGDVGAAAAFLAAYDSQASGKEPR